MDESAVKGLEVVELKGSDAGIRNSSIITRMVGKGYDTSPPTPPKEVVEEAMIWDTTPSLLLLGRLSKRL